MSVRPEALRISSVRLLRTCSVVLLATTTGLLGLGCSEDGPNMSATPHYDEETLHMKYEVMLSLIEDLSCTSGSDCGTVAVGTKACGGTEAYLVYSIATVDGPALSNAVADFNEYQAGYRAEHGDTISDCMLTPVPLPDCLADKCVVP